MQWVFDPEFHEASLPGLPFALDFTNDGSLLACASGGDDNLAHVVRVFRTGDGSLVTSFMQPGVENGRGVVFVADGRELIFLFQRPDNTRQLYRIALDSREPVELRRYPPALHHAIIRDRSARRFAVLSSDVEVWDADEGRILRTFRGANRSYQTRAVFSRDGARLYLYGSVENWVVRYNVESGEEEKRWEAPTPFGRQVLVSPDETFLVIAGTGYKGVFFYDLVQNQRVMMNKDGIRTFDETTIGRPWTVTPDGELLISHQAAIFGYRLPAIEEAGARLDVTVPGVRSWEAASAWDAPVVAFGSDDLKLRWFRLIAAQD